MNRTFSRLRTASAVTCLLASFSACGDDSPTPTTPPVATPTTTTTTQPAATLIVEGNELIPSAEVFFIDLTTPRPGRVSVTVDYGSTENAILLWLTDRQCSFTLFDRDACDFLVKSMEGPKPRTMSADNVPAGTYTLFVANDGPGDEQIRYRVTLTP